MAQDERITNKNSSNGAKDTASRIKHWRTEAGLKAVDLARALEMSEASVSRWESSGSDNEPTTKILRKIAEVCGVSMQIFWGRLPEPEASEKVG